MNYQKSGNIDPLCDENEMKLNIIIPPSLIWVEEDAKFFTVEDSVRTSISVMQEDTMLVIPFDGKNSGFFNLRFISKCPDRPIKNFNPDIPVEEQCIEWNTYNLKATIDNQCGENCNRSIRTTTTYSATFRTLCEEDEDYQYTLLVDSFIINRMNGG